MANVVPASLDFSEDGRWPAIVYVKLGNGYQFSAAASDDEARKVIALVQEWCDRDSIESVTTRGLSG